MRTVYKYDLKIADLQAIELPKNSRILSVVNQAEKPVLYADVNTEETEKERRFIRMTGTGQDLFEKDPARQNNENTKNTCDHINHLEFINSMTVHAGYGTFHFFEARF